VGGARQREDLDVGRWVARDQPEQEARAVAIVVRWCDHRTRLSRDADGALTTADARPGEI
jgi:hypothetical protein